MHATLDALAIALYVQIDDFLPARSGPGRPPKLSDAELITLAVCQMLLGLPNDRQFLALARYDSPTCSIEADGFAQSKADLKRLHDLTDREIDDRLDGLLTSLRLGAPDVQEQIPGRNLWVAVTSEEPPLLRISSALARACPGSASFSGSKDASGARLACA